MDCWSYPLSFSAYQPFLLSFLFSPTTWPHLSHSILEQSLKIASFVGNTLVTSSHMETLTKWNSSNHMSLSWKIRKWILAMLSVSIVFINHLPPLSIFLILTDHLVFLEILKLSPKNLSFVGYFTTLLRLLALIVPTLVWSPWVLPFNFG